MDPAQVTHIVSEVNTLSIAALARKHGDWFYLITFIWTMLEGETFVIFAGMAAYHKLLAVHWLILCAWIGSFTGDQICFFLGRKFGKRIFNRFPKLNRPRRAILGWVERHSTGFILSYRFMYGLRNISAIVIGMTDIPWRRFAILNLTAALLWATSFVLIGYFFADTAKKLVENSAVAFTIAVVVMFLVIVTVRYIMRRVSERSSNKQNIPDA